MKTTIKLQDKVIVADPKDNVATARVEIKAGVVLSREGRADIHAGLFYNAEPEFLFKSIAWLFRPPVFFFLWPCVF